MTSCIQSHSYRIEICVPESNRHSAIYAFTHHRKEEKIMKKREITIQINLVKSVCGSRAHYSIKHRRAKEMFDFLPLQKNHMCIVEMGRSGIEPLMFTARERIYSPPQHLQSLPSSQEPAYKPALIIVTLIVYTREI